MTTNKPPCTYDPDEWFIEPDGRRLLGDEPTPNRDRRRAHAISLCHTACPVRLQCLDEGLRPENLEYGIWGGYTEIQRQQVVAAIEDRRRTRRMRGKST